MLLGFINVFFVESDAHCVGFFCIFADEKKTVMKIFQIIVIVLFLAIIICAFAIPLIIIISIFFACDEENDYSMDAGNEDYDE